MNTTISLRDTVLDEFYTAVRTTKKLLEKAEPDIYDFKPAGNMRSFMELANHLVQIPHVDLAIIQEKSEAEIRELEKKLTSSTTEQLSLVFEEGYHLLKSYYLSMTEEEFLTRKSKPFYAEKAVTQVTWFVEMLTHAFHHRAQLFTYLKQTGHDVTMFDLY